MGFVEEHHELIRAVYMGRFVARVRAAGLDPDDTLQLVYLKLLKAEQGRSPYSPKRASPSTYVYLACSSVLMNEADKRRRRGWEVLGDEDAALDGRLAVRDGAWMAGRRQTTRPPMRRAA